MLNINDMINDGRKLLEYNVIDSIKIIESELLNEISYYLGNLKQPINTFKS